MNPLARLLAAVARLVVPIRLDVATINLHVTSRHQVAGLHGVIARIRAAYGRWPDLIGTQEAIQLQGVASLFGGRYRVVKTLRRRLHDNTNVIVLKHRFTVLSSAWHYGAPAFGHGMNHQIRHFHVLKFLKRGRKIAMIDAHLSVINEPLGRVSDPAALSGPVARTHAFMVTKIADKADQLRREGYVVVIVADSNDNVAWQYALRTVLAARGYRSVHNGIDVIIVHPTQVKPRRRKLLIPTWITRSDHQGVAAGFVIRRAMPRHARHRR